jgi:phosphotransferase system  glucose/maltose/N-acetylglucosamine-specific IIC component
MMIFIRKLGFNIPILIAAIVTILGGIADVIFENGNSASLWEIATMDQFGRFAMNGLTMFMVFLAANYTKFGGKNGVLGMIYLSGVYCVMGFGEWAWNKWDEDFVNWWIETIGGKDSPWDLVIAGLFCLVGWLISIPV